ncbi:homeobox domain containing protein [Acanthamoeba castellanii str. Neff]|uniref:Homeobox domain containing protein n=1 Tax=Acanthamoeba castellanii (strain ATCC 30010 / Neff) TaxID=1257118 RepID=L8HKG7_ACACF|nr:homeobox domain containing protein [Acanthamoeba castellanii str. Neff]ELR25717.1 homeobox domain containing protein [Acanthamoeba castellanii str. Neff]
MDEQGRQVVRERIAGLLVQFPGEARAWAQTIEEEAFKAAQDETRYFETISRRLATLASTPPSELAGLPATAPSSAAEDEAQQPPQKKKNLGRRPNPKRPDKVPIAFILPAPVATRPVSQQAPRDRAVPKDLWLQTLHSYQAPLDALVTKTRTRAESTPPMMSGKDGAHRQQLLELLQQMHGLAPPTAQNDKVCQDLLDRIAEWLLWDVNGGPLFPTMGPASTMNTNTTTTTTTTASTPSEPAKRKRRASADDNSRAARRTRKSRIAKSGSSPSSPAATQHDYASAGAPAVAHDAPRGLFPFHGLLVEAEEGKLAAEGRISPRCVSALPPAGGLAVLPLPSSAGPAIRSPTSAFTPWGEKRRSGSQAEDELSAATAIEALSSNRPSLLPSPVKKEPVDSSEVSGSEGEDGEDVREVESEKPSRRGKKRSAKHEDAKKERLSKRRLKTPQQLEILETEYAITRFPNTAKRQAISVATGLTPRGVQIWFQNKRAKDKFFESSAQKYMAKREVPSSSGQHAGGGSGAAHYPALLPTPIVADAHFPLLGTTPLPRIVSLPPISAPPHYPQRQHQHQHPPPILPPLSSLSPPRPRSSSSSPAHIPLLPPISSLPAFSLMHSSFAEPGTTSSSRSSSPLSCPLNLVNVPPNFSSPSASRSASPSSYQQLPHATGGGGGSPMDLNTLISSLNNTINFLTALHSIAPSTQTSSPVCAWQGEIVWQGIVPVAAGSGPEPAPSNSSSSSGGALPRLYSCQVSIPLVCLSSDRNCISVMERCAAQMSVASMHPRGDRAYENVIESSEQAGTVLEFLPSSEGARQSVAFLLDQLSSAPPTLRSAQLATVNVDSRHQLVMFAAQGRLLGCLANLTCSPSPAHNARP